MKTLVLKMLSLFFLVVGGTVANGQQSQPEVPGDNFSLEGALELFKKSDSPEEFERLLNSSNSKVNNLDLNGDGDVDYIRVIDRNEGNVHAFIIQAIISERESQDVAVIELEKLDNGKAVLQIIGDEDVYGIETIIEPTQEVRVNAGTSTSRVAVNVWAWPSVQYVYSPYYTVWTSPWHWTVWPIWWHRWSPVAYYVYDPWWQPYRPYYSPCHTHRIAYAHQIYHPYRTTSVFVYGRHRTQIAHYRSTYRDRDHYSRRKYDEGRYNDRVDRTSYNTPTVRQRSTSNENRNSRSLTNTRGHQREQDFIKKPKLTRDDISTNRSESRDNYRKPELKRDDISFDRSDSRSNSNASQRNSNVQKREHSQRNDQGSINRDSHQRTQSVGKVERTRSSGNSDGNRSGNHGNGGGKSNHGKRRG